MRVCENIAIDSGTLSVAVLKRAAQRDVPFLASRVLGKNSTAADHRQIDEFEGLREARIESASKDENGAWRRFPVEVDGDYIGEHGELELGIDVGALQIVA
jgi:diacylglycerol kinase family enzyme